MQQPSWVRAASIRVVGLTRPRPASSSFRSNPGRAALRGGFRRPLADGWPPVGANAHGHDQKGPYSKNHGQKESTHARSSVCARPEGGAVGPKWNPDAPRCQVILLPGRQGRDRAGARVSASNPRMDCSTTLATDRPAGLEERRRPASLTRALRAIKHLSSAIQMCLARGHRYRVCLSSKPLVGRSFRNANQPRVTGPTVNLPQHP